jgi:hypothetical protein
MGVSYTSVGFNEDVNEIILIFELFSRLLFLELVNKT